MEYKMKLVMRYILIGFMMYLSWMILQPEWLNAVKIKASTYNVIVGATLGVLGWIVKEHFGTKIRKYQ